MPSQVIANDVLCAIGGIANIAFNSVCMTRLRISCVDPQLINTEQLRTIHGVLGVAYHESGALEIVFGPGKVQDINQALSQILLDARKITPSKRTDTSSYESVSEPSDNPYTTTQNDQKGGLDNNAVRASNNKKVGSDTTRLIETDEMTRLLHQVEQNRSSEDLATKTSIRENKDHTRAHTKARLLVINGPNINLLGICDTSLYGNENYQDLLTICQKSAKEAGFAQCSCFQSNHEGDLVEAIQDAYDAYDAIVINPGAYAHTSIALLDAAVAVGLPMVEVHISPLDKRETFRQHSYIRSACQESIVGMGCAGYRKAIFDLAAHLQLKAINSTDTDQH